MDFAKKDVPGKLVLIVNNRKLRHRKKYKLICSVIEKLTLSGEQIELHKYSSDEEVKALCGHLNHHLTIRQLIIAGGDGSINAVLQHWLRYDIPIAFIPLGTCNLFAKECGYTQDPELISNIILNGYPRRFFCGKVNDHRFQYVGGCGIDGYICKVINRKLKQTYGRVYLGILLFFELIKKSRPNFEISINDQPASQVSTLLFAKGKYYGGKFIIAPDANIFTNELYALFYKRTSRWHEFKLIIALFTNKLYQHKDVTLVSAKNIAIKTPGAQPALLQKNYFSQKLSSLCFNKLSG